ncbi:MAG TPA: CoA transferase [Burkholderiaceae bacterium]|nr:CoA transferase [Burkholderiaceae bacterium]
MSAEHPLPTGPLAGLRIVDFTRVLSGPFCTALLADLGAEVIKVEPPQGDDYRAIGPMRNGESALFNVMNRNKHSVVLDLKLPDAQALARELCARADVVVENFRPGVADKLGIGYAAVRAINPRVVYASISGFGQTGPTAHRPAYDIVLQAMSGLMEATGSPDGPPTLVGEAVSDVVSGLFASWGVLAALLGRERNGQGTHVDVAMLDATLAFTATSVSRFLFTGRNPVRVGNRHPLSAPFGVYAAADGHYVLAVLNNKLFAQLCAVIGQPALATDPRFATDELRSQNEPALRAAIEAWSGTLTVNQVVQHLEAAAVPTAPIWNVEQALNSPQSQHRGVLQAVDDPQLPGLRLPTQPLQFSAYERAAVQRAPRLGEHTDVTLQRVLGLAAGKVAELRALGAFGH